jgi:hypothetical protein
MRHQRSTPAHLILTMAVSAAAIAIGCAPASAAARLAASTTAARTAGPQSGAAAEAASCVIHSLPSMMREGELANVGEVGDIVEVECDSAVIIPGTKVEIEDSQLYSRCGGKVTWVDPNEFATGELKEEKGRSITVEVDGEGNATVALVAGPNCSVGGTVVAAHTQAGGGNKLVESFSAAFAVESARVTPPGATVTPAIQVEDEESSSVATLVQAESSFTETRVRVAAPQLYSACELAPHVTWLRANGELVAGKKELAGGSALEPAGDEAIKTDNDGNAFVVAIGDSSCQPGKTYFEVDLEEGSFETFETPFTILPPQPTPEPDFSIEKLQQIDGAGKPYTTEALTATVGQTVDYQVIVTNTTTVPETFAGFVDPNCDAGTISGPASGASVAPGVSITYTCSRALAETGMFSNQAEITGSTPVGTGRTKASNVVQVTVSEAPKPSFVVEKLQRIAGSGGALTPDPVEGVVGQTVEYEITARNTGNTALSFEPLEDAYCDPGTLEGGPGLAPVAPSEATTWRCSRALTSEGTFDNLATATAAAPGGKPITQPSQTVEAIVKGPAHGTGKFTVEKLQRLAGSGTAYTGEQLTGAIGQTVEYEIIVKNVGTTVLAVSAPNDPYCDAGTLEGGEGASSLEPGHTTTFSCSRYLATEGSFVNVAEVVATPPGEMPIEQPSPPVEVKVPVVTPSHGLTPVTMPVVTPAREPGKGEVAGVCEASTPSFRGATGSKRGSFTVRVGAAGIAQITFYLDGHKLKTLTGAQARNGVFSLKVNAHKLSYGAHRVSYTAVRTNTNCAKVASAHVFVRPRAARVKPRFTG